MATSVAADMGVTNWISTGVGIVKHALFLPFIVCAFWLLGGMTCLAQSNVQAWLDENETLHIVGDQQAAHLQITVIARQVIKVEGFDGFQTTVNGSEESIKFFDVDSIDIRLKDADDLIYIDGKDLPWTILGSLTIASGYGNDRIGFKDFSGGDDIRIEMSGDGDKKIEDDDVFYASGLRGTRSFSLTTGAGSDLIEFDDPETDEKNWFGITASIDSGSRTSDPDTVLLRQLDAELEVVTSEGADTITVVDSRSFYPQRIFAGGGDDNVVAEQIVSRSWISGGFGAVLVDLGRGNNRLAVVDAQAEGEFKIFSESGSDTVTIEASSIYDLQVQLGNGNDVLVFKDTYCEKCGLHGGGDKDRLYHSNSIFDGFPVYTGWESIRGN